MRPALAFYITAKRLSSSKLSFFKGTGKDSAPKQDVPDSVRFVNKSDGYVLESPQGNGEMLWINKCILT